MDEVRPLQGPSALYSLDEPRAVRPGVRWAWILGIMGYALAIAVIASHGSTFLPPIIWVPVAHAIVVAVICGFTAVIILGQATASGRRGYLILGGTYLYIALLLAAFPLLFPGAIRAEAPLLGGPQSSIAIFYSWHVMALLGLIASIHVLWYDQRTHRRPSLAVSIPQVIVCASATSDQRSRSHARRDGPRPLMDQRMDHASVSTDRRMPSISSNSGWPMISGGANWITGSPRSSARQYRPASNSALDRNPRRSRSASSSLNVSLVALSLTSSMP